LRGQTTVREGLYTPMKRIRIALVGDFDEKMHTHVALNASIAHCRSHISSELDVEWISTDRATNGLSLSKNKYNGLWIAPGSPYKDDEAVYNVIQKARENNIPMMGSCGGFQFMLIEYARNVLNIHDAGHQESDSTVNNIISKLSCSLKGQQEQVYIADRTSWLYDVLKTDSIIGKYYCSYGVNPAFQEKLNNYPMVFTAFSPVGEIRAFELRGHRFFKGTLFQPSLDSSMEHPNPLIVDFFNVCGQ
jgi:CTP synthase (UTP-ammonia lyase)